MQTASIQWANRVHPIDFAIELFQPLRDGRSPILGQQRKHVTSRCTNNLQDIEASDESCREWDHVLDIYM